VITGLISVVSGMGARLGYRGLSASSIKQSWYGSWTCGAASPAPSASRMVSTMSVISDWMVALWISSGATRLAGTRSTGSPSWAIFRRTMRWSLREELAPSHWRTSSRAGFAAARSDMLSCVHHGEVGAAARGVF
jgi:hypothetical protein